MQPTFGRRMWIAAVLALVASSCGESPVDYVDNPQVFFSGGEDCPTCPQLGEKEYQALKAQIENHLRDDPFCASIYEAFQTAYAQGLWHIYPEPNIYSREGTYEGGEFSIAERWFDRNIVNGIEYVSLKPGYTIPEFDGEAYNTVFHETLHEPAWGLQHNTGIRYYAGSGSDKGACFDN